MRSLQTPMSLVVGVVLALTVSSCSPAVLQGISQGLAGASHGTASGGFETLMLFGGSGNSTYLGCLSCSEYARDSIFNSYGPHGSRYSTQSIFNPYSQFGSRYSQYSPCNRYAAHPPVVVDDAGNYYGRLTLNSYHAERYGDGEVLAWLAAICN